MRVILGVVVIVIAVAAGFWGGTNVTSSVPQQPVSSSSEQRDSTVVDAITRVEEVALVSLGIQGITHRSESSTLFGIQVPGSERTSYLQYSFSAKLDSTVELSPFLMTTEWFTSRFPSLCSLVTTM